MRTAVYIRVSTEEQVNEGYSISAQRERLQAYITSQNWDAVGFYVDEGVSAKNTERPQLKRMLKHIEEGFIDVVLVYRLDRLTRSVLDLYQLLDTFERNGCKFKSATEVYDTTTAMGRLFITLVAALAQWERENLGERVRMGMTQRTREGQWHGSSPAYGYKYENGIVSIDEEKANIVRWIYMSYIEGMSDQKLAVKLNEQGIPTQKGGSWRESTIRRILQNETYTGKLMWGVRVNKENAFSVDGAMPKIIEQGIFDKAQSIRKGRARVHPRQATSKHIFSGALRCARCGAAMKGHKKTEKGKEYRSYRCINRYNHTCDMPMISQKILEETFITYFKDVEIVGSYQPPKENEESPLNVEEELDQIKKRRKKWQYAWANDLMSDEEYTERIREEEAKEEELLKVIDNKQKQTSAEEVSILSAFITEQWNKLDVLEKKTFIQNTVESIRVDKVAAQRQKDRVKILDVKFK
ncbi:recombinase family protein [Shouchella tritolerans]|uniref:recombinase family protein n=1 Tax=Shouchella tritolerans TaxID=2979466 RepID=UPI0021E866E2|nr:recombinase family protein [Shouchella tritolerans]